MLLGFSKLVCFSFSYLLLFFGLFGSLVQLVNVFLGVLLDPLVSELLLPLFFLLLLKFDFVELFHELLSLVLELRRWEAHPYQQLWLLNHDAVSIVSKKKSVLFILFGS